MQANAYAYARMNAHTHTKSRTESTHLTLYLTTWQVGKDPPTSTTKIPSGKAQVQIPGGQDGFICVGGSRAGQPCAGNVSTLTSDQLELVCPGGGSCVVNGEFGGGILGSWSFGAILGAFVLAAMAAIAVAMKMSADHRRKKRAREHAMKQSGDSQIKPTTDEIMP